MGQVHANPSRQRQCLKVCRAGPYSAAGRHVVIPHCSNSSPPPFSSGSGAAPQKSRMARRSWGHSIKSLALPEWAPHRAASADQPTAWPGRALLRFPNLLLGQYSPQSRHPNEPKAYHISSSLPVAGLGRLNPMRFSVPAMSCFTRVGSNDSYSHRESRHANGGLFRYGMPQINTG